MTAVNGFGLLLTRSTWQTRCFGATVACRLRKIARSSAAAGLGVDVQVTTGAKRAGWALIVKAAGAAALVVAFTDTIFAQSGSDFLNNVDPLFSGVLTHPGNLDNTGH